MGEQRTARVLVHGVPAGLLVERRDGTYAFTYDPGYEGPPVSLTLPRTSDAFTWSTFPPFFDGLLPEGWQLDALLRTEKLDRSDRMGQLLAVGGDTVGAVTVVPVSPEDASEEADA
jgi:serine/threonine-protein kinase HipA